MLNVLQLQHLTEAKQADDLVLVKEQGYPFLTLSQVLAHLRNKEAFPQVTEDDVRKLILNPAAVEAEVQNLKDDDDEKVIRKEARADGEIEKYWQGKAAEIAEIVGADIEAAKGIKKPTWVVDIKTGPGFTAVCSDGRKLAEPGTPDGYDALLKQIGKDQYTFSHFAKQNESGQGLVAPLHRVSLLQKLPPDVREKLLRKAAELSVVEKQIHDNPQGVSGRAWAARDKRWANVELILQKYFPQQRDADGKLIRSSDGFTEDQLALHQLNVENAFRKKAAAAPATSSVSPDQAKQNESGQGAKSGQGTKSGFSVYGRYDRTAYDRLKSGMEKSFRKYPVPAEWLIDPPDLSHVNDTDTQLEMFAIFASLTGGGTASNVIAVQLPRLLAYSNAPTPYGRIKDLAQRNVLSLALYLSGFGQQIRRTKQLTQLANEFPVERLRSMQPEEFGQVHGNGHKVVDFFTTYAREQGHKVPLDVHVLRWLRDECGHANAPRITPADRAEYERWQQVVHSECGHRFPGKSPRECDQAIWTARARTVSQLGEALVPDQIIAAKHVEAVRLGQVAQFLVKDAAAVELLQQILQHEGFVGYQVKDIEIRQSDFDQYNFFGGQEHDDSAEMSVTESLDEPPHGFYPCEQCVPRTSHHWWNHVHESGNGTTLRRYWIKPDGELVPVPRGFDHDGYAEKLLVEEDIPSINEMSAYEVLEYHGWGIVTVEGPNIIWLNIRKPERRQIKAVQDLAIENHWEFHLTTPEGGDKLVQESKVTESLDEAFANWHYQLPADPRKQLYDFYVLSFFADKVKSLDPTDDATLAVDEALDTLIAELKPKLLQGLKLAVAAEFRHIYDANHDIKRLQEWFAKHNGLKFFNSYTRNYNLLKGGLEDVLRNPQTVVNDFAKENRGYVDSYKAISATGISDAAFMYLAAKAYRELNWSSQFGGEKWARIAEGWTSLANAKTREQNITMIDHVYDLEHNTGVVFNKVKSFMVDGGYDWIKKALNHKRDATSLYELVDKASGQLSGITAYLLKKLYKTTVEMDKATKLQAKADSFAKVQAPAVKTAPWKLVTTKMVPPGYYLVTQKAPCEVLNLVQNNFNNPEQGAKVIQAYANAIGEPLSLVWIDSEGKTGNPLITMNPNVPKPATPGNAAVASPAKQSQSSPLGLGVGQYKGPLTAEMVAKLKDGYWAVAKGHYAGPFTSLKKAGEYTEVAPSLEWMRVLMVIGGVIEESIEIDKLQKDLAKKAKTQGVATVGFGPAYSYLGLPKSMADLADGYWVFNQQHHVGPFSNLGSAEDYVKTSTAGWIRIVAVFDGKEKASYPVGPLFGKPTPGKKLTVIPPDHKSTDEYIEAQKKCGLQKGDKVQLLGSVAQGTAGWSAVWCYPMDDCIGKIGTIVGGGGANAEGFAVAFEPGVSWALPYFALKKVEKAVLSSQGYLTLPDSLKNQTSKQYVEEQAKAGFKKGDYVKVLAKVEKGTGGWSSSWTTLMDVVVGEIGVVLSLGHFSTGVQVSFANKGSWYLPYFDLEKVEAADIDPQETKPVATAGGALMLSPSIASQSKADYLKGEAACGLQPGDKVKLLGKVPSQAGGWGSNWVSGINPFIGKVGVIVPGQSYENYGLVVQFDSDLGTFALPYFALEKVSDSVSDKEMPKSQAEYIEAQKQANFQKGDRVLVTKKAMGYEHGWNNPWISAQDKLVGQTGTVVAKPKDFNNFADGIPVWFAGSAPESYYFFPYFVLEKVKDDTNKKPDLSGIANSPDLLIGSKGVNSVSVENFKKGWYVITGDGMVGGPQDSPESTKAWLKKNSNSVDVNTVFVFVQDGKIAEVEDVQSLIADLESEESGQTNPDKKDWTGYEMGWYLWPMTGAVAEPLGPFMSPDAAWDHAKKALLHPITEWQAVFVYNQKEIQQVPFTDKPPKTTPHVVDSKLESSYVAEQKKCGLKPGIYVKVLTTAVKGELGWGDSWLSTMDKLVGKTGKISSDQGVHGFRVSFPEMEHHMDSTVWDLPFFVLAQSGPDEISKAWTQDKPDGYYIQTFDAGGNPTDIRGPLETLDDVQDTLARMQIGNLSDITVWHVEKGKAHQVGPGVLAAAVKASKKSDDAAGMEPPPSPKKSAAQYLKDQEKDGFKPGEMVKILTTAADYEDGWDNTWSEPMDKLVGKIGKIPTGSVIDAAGIPVIIEGSPIFRFPYFVLGTVEAPEMDYIKAQNKSGLMAGDQVKIVSQAESMKQGWKNIWTSEMTKLIGKQGQIPRWWNDPITAAGVPVKVPGIEYFYFPYFVLEKVAPTKESVAVVQLRLQEAVALEAAGRKVQQVDFRYTSWAEYRQALQRQLACESIIGCLEGECRHEEEKGRESVRENLSPVAPAESPGADGGRV